MNLKILHTADWHIGQFFFEYDRNLEHLHFFENLKKIIEIQEIDSLIICGDIFDVSNPSSYSISIFYKLLIELTNQFSYLQIIIIGGNHDSASRLELPNPILKHFNIKIIGNIEKDINGKILHEKLIIPLKNKNGEIAAYCMAIPFLRPGEVPSVTNSISPYSDGVIQIYTEVLAEVEKIKTNKQAIIALGHLHTIKAEISENDKNERLILGGLELINLQCFNERISYFALGHLHKAQKIFGLDHFRYSGSPIPMSFSEKNYQHQVVVIEFENNKAKKIESIEIPRLIELLRIPQKHEEIQFVLNKLNKLESNIGNEEIKKTAPYLEVRVLLKEPEPNLRYKIEKEIENKNVRLAKIDVKYYNGNQTNTANFINNEELQNLNPINIFEKIFQSKYNTEIPEKYKILFKKTLNEISK